MEAAEKDIRNFDRMFLVVRTIRVGLDSELDGIVIDAHRHESADVAVSAGVTFLGPRPERISGDLSRMFLSHHFATEPLDESTILTRPKAC